MKGSHTAVCMTAAGACVLGIAIAASTGQPGLALVFLFGVSVPGLVCFLLDIRV